MQSSPERRVRHVRLALVLSWVIIVVGGIVVVDEAAMNDAFFERLPCEPVVMLLICDWSSQGLCFFARC